MHLLVRPSKKPGTYNDQVKAFGSYNYMEQIALAEFNSGGTQADVDRLKQVMAAARPSRAAAGQGAMTAEAAVTVACRRASTVRSSSGMAQQIGQGQDPEDLAKKGITPETWMAAATAKFQGYATVEDELVTKAVNEAAKISSDAKRDAIVNGLAVVIALLAAFLVAGLMARQMSRSMRQLRTAAFSIAEQRLPSLVDQLSRTDPGRVDTRVQPIPITTQDEIGEVARASTRCTARPSGSPPSRPCCGATSTRSSPTSRAATSRSSRAS
ncbi:Signal transduction histidine-protein kinase/phosphatase MprB OS=Streptomyces microflavus OX=1919 GN=Smic_60220 PE=4 SV=1 [Streptomyces microflavus]